MSARDRLRSSWNATSPVRVAAWILVAVLAALAFRAGGAWLANLVAVMQGARP
jgi:hypothetical protein